MTTLLIEYPWLAPTLFWVLTLACALLGYVLLLRGAARMLLALSAVGVLGIAALTLSPTGDHVVRFCTAEWTVPFQGDESFANIALFVPASLFAVLALRRPRVVLVGLSGLSAVIELVQALTPQLGRYCDTNDWLMNTVGAAVGVVTGWAVSTLVARRARRHHLVAAPGRPPGPRSAGMTMDADDAVRDSQE